MTLTHPHHSILLPYQKHRCLNCAFVDFYFNLTSTLHFSSISFTTLPYTSVQTQATRYAEFNPPPFSSTCPAIFTCPFSPDVATVEPIQARAHSQHPLHACRPSLRTRPLLTQYPSAIALPASPMASHINRRSPSSNLSQRTPGYLPNTSPYLRP